MIAHNGHPWRSCWWIAAILLLGVLALGHPADGVQAQGTPPKPGAVAPATFPGCAGTVPAWGIGYSSNQLVAVSALGPEDAWAVGWRRDLGPRIMAQHWDGKQWNYLTPPDTSDPGVLTGVAMAAHDNVWAVGTSRRTEHWDGTQWTLVPNPSPESLKAVVALGPADVWAAGGSTIIHWDGLSWSIVAHPPVSGALTALAAQASDDVWVVGVADVLHWDGIAWTQMPSPPGGTLVSVAAPAANDAWVLGRAADSAALVVQHWDGTAWSVVPLPALATTRNTLTSIAAGAPDDVWVVGNGYGDSDYQTLVLHWDGSAWQVVPSGNADLDDNELLAVSAPAPGVMLAVGSYQQWEHGYDTALSVRYTPTCLPPPPPPCDGAFHIVPSPNVYNSSGFFYGVAAPASNDAWAVGAAHPGGDALLTHWDGQRWQRVTPPGNATLYAVSARTADDIWAVGDQIIHWDGAQWTAVAGPPGLTGPLRGVVALAADDVWAVGAQIIHWDGSAWSVSAHPARQPLAAIAAIAATDAWAAGGHTLIHWDGNTWQVVPGPADLDYHGLAAVSANDAWAVGSTTESFAHQRIVHWDGQAWTVVPEVNARGVFNAVLARSANDVWVAGIVTFDGSNDVYPAMMHWDGHAWTTVSVPWPINIRGSLFAALASGPGTSDLWAVGNTALADTLTERLQPPCWDQSN
jgi:hypothetical protein